MSEAPAQVEGMRSHPVWEQARALQTVGADWADKPPHRGKQGKEQSVILGRPGWFGGKEILFG